MDVLKDIQKKVGLLHHFEERLEDVECKQAEIEQKQNDIHQLLYEGGVEDRSVVDDMMLFRKLVNRFGSLRVLIGAVIGFMSFAISAVYGGIKLYEFIEAMIKTKGT